MNLNFNFSGKINPALITQFNNTATDIRYPFIEFVDSISKEFGTNFDWWVSGPASRNTFTSPLYYYCCCFVLLQELINANEIITEISTDSEAFKRIIEEYLNQIDLKINVIYSLNSKQKRLKKIIKSSATIIKVSIIQLTLFLCAKTTKNKNNINYKNNDYLTLIDTFLLPGFIDEDRYYPNIFDSLTENELNSIYFVPSIHGFKPFQYLSIINKIRLSKRRLLLKEDYLKISDYIYAWLYILRTFKFRISEQYFYDYDFSPLLIEEIRYFKEFGASFTALLNYRFPKRLKQSGIKLRLVINWFENQLIDKGWNAGFKKYYTDISIKGYQGFCSLPQYLCMFPTEQERLSGVIPDEIMVIGEEMVNSSKRYCPDLNVSIAPAFRYKNIRNERYFFPDKNYYTVLVALPVNLNDSVEILNLLAKAEKQQDKNVRFWIKPHPIINQDKIKMDLRFNWPDKFTFVNGVFAEFVEKSDVVISSESTAGLETLAKGIPVIIIASQAGLSFNAMPENISTDIWKVCNTPQELSKAIRFYKNRTNEKIKEHMKFGSWLRDKYFEPVSREGINIFFSYNNL